MELRLYYAGMEGSGRRVTRRATLSSGLRQEMHGRRELGGTTSTRWRVPGRKGAGRSHEPWSEEELPTARSQELNTAQLRIAVNCNVHVERKQGTFSGLMWLGQAARSEAGLGQMILAEPTGASLSCHQPLVPIHGEEGVVQRGGEGEARRAREEPLGTRLCAGIRSWM